MQSGHQNALGVFILAKIVILLSHPSKYLGRPKDHHLPQEKSDLSSPQFSAILTAPDKVYPNQHADGQMPRSHSTSLHLKI